MTMGKKIKDLRKSLGMTQQQLGGDEFTKGYISQIEKGTVTPSMKVLTLIASRLSRPISYFLDDDIYLRMYEEKFVEGKNLYLQQHYDKAAEIFQEILTNSSPQKGLIYSSSTLYLGKCYYNLKNYEEGIKILREGVHHLAKLSLLEKLVEAHLYEGLCHFSLLNYTTAIESFKKGLVLIEEKNLLVHNLTAKLQLNIATGYSNLGKLTLALQGFEGNIKFCKSKQINDTLLDCNVRSSYINYLLGNLKKAKKKIVTANSINKNLNYEIVSTEIYNILGMIVYKEGKTKAALALLYKSLSICEEIKYEWGYYDNICDIVSILLETNQLLEAEALINTHLENIQCLENHKILYKVLILKGKVEVLRGNISKAINLYSRGIDGFIKMDSKWEVYHYSKALAELLMEVAPTEAKKYYNLSIEYLSQVTSLNP